jgi:two-component system, cell cycle sensor histidine kinase and response regulator CckA
VIGNVRAHQGLVTVESAVGQGTMFTVLLPATAEAVTPRIDPPALADIRGRGTILVIDDEPAVCETSTRFLKHLGYDTIAADNGQAGIAGFEAHHAALVCVLLDLTMPGMSGIAVMAELRKRDLSIPIVLMSGYTQADVADVLAKTPGVSFLSKPFTPTALGQHVQAIITSTRAGQAPEAP